MFCIYHGHPRRKCCGEIGSRDTVISIFYAECHSLLKNQKCIFSAIPTVIGTNERSMESSTRDLAQCATQNKRINPDRPRRQKISQTETFSTTGATPTAKASEGYVMKKRQKITNVGDMINLEPLADNTPTRIRCGLATGL